MPWKIGLNWFMPALAKSSVGSSYGMVLLDGMYACAWWSLKKSMNDLRTCAAVHVSAAMALFL